MFVAIRFTGRFKLASCRGHEKLISISGTRLDLGQSSHVGLERLGNVDTPVSALVIFEDRHERATNCQAGAVKGVREFRLAALGAIARLHAAGLERFHIGAGRNFAVGVLRREPDLDIVSARAAKTHVAGAEDDGAIGQLQALQDALGVGGELFQRGGRFFCPRHPDELDFVELVLADEAAHVPPARPGLGTKARRMRHKAQRQLDGIDDLIAHQIGQRHFGCGNEVVALALSVLHGEEVFLEFRELPRAAQRLRRHDVRHVGFGVAMFGGVNVEHELGKGPMQAGDRPAQHGKTRTGDARSGLEVQPEVCPDIDVVAHREFKRARGAPSAQLDVLRLIRADGHVGRGQIGNGHEQSLQFGLQGVEPGGVCFQRGFDVADLFHDRRDILAFGFGLPDLLGEQVAPRLQIFGLFLQGFALGFEGFKAGHIEEGLRALTGFEPGDDVGQVFAQQGDVEHDAFELNEK